MKHFRRKKSPSIFSLRIYSIALNSSATIHKKYLLASQAPKKFPWRSHSTRVNPNPNSQNCRKTTVHSTHKKMETSPTIQYSIETDTNYAPKLRFCVKREVWSIVSKMQIKLLTTSVWVVVLGKAQVEKLFRCFLSVRGFFLSSWSQLRFVSSSQGWALDVCSVVRYVEIDFLMKCY